jgi:hypothetical protein
MVARMQRPPLSLRLPTVHIGAFAKRIGQLGRTTTLRGDASASATPSESVNRSRSTSAAKPSPKQSANLSPRAATGFGQGGAGRVPRTRAKNSAAAAVGAKNRTAKLSPYLTAKGIVIEKEVSWPRGGRSLYFREPAGNVVELVTPGVWGTPAGW